MGALLGVRRHLLTGLILALALQRGATGFTPVLQHEVSSVPGFTGKLASRHYTGHIPVRNGEHQLFYWLVESEYDAANDPVVLWLTGGPGCSGLDALIYEHGPFLFDIVDSGKKGDSDIRIKLRRNPYSWSQAATMIYVESPASVGFSYSTMGPEVDSDDNEATDDLLEFITHMLTHVYPHLQDRDFFIAGESYGGVYVPLLASKVLRHNREAPAELRLNLQGYATGNGVTDDFYDGNGQPEFAYNMGLIDPATYDTLIDVCGGQNRFWNATPGGDCDRVIRDAYSTFYWVNPYDILADCSAPRSSYDTTHASQSQPNTPTHANTLKRSLLSQVTRSASQTHDMRQPQADTQQTSAAAAEQQPVSSALKASAAAGKPALRWPLAGVRGSGSAKRVHIALGVDASVGVDGEVLRRGGSVSHWQGMVGYSVPCEDRRASRTWLNLPEVRTALHAPPVESVTWEPCSDHLHYLMQPESLIDYHRRALDAGLRVLVYSGDHDFVVPFTGTRAWVYSMGLRIAEPYGPWYVGKQVAGFRVRFSEGLEFMTVKGAGHMVPQTNPRPALHLILRFLHPDATNRLGDVLGSA